MLALEVARLEGTIEGVLLIDVAARGLSMSMQDGECEMVIAQSAVVPTREYRLLATRQDDQPRIEFDLVGRRARPPRRRTATSGATRSSILPPAPAGDVLVLVEVTLDTDGVARLGATELVSGERLTLDQIFHVGLTRAEVGRLTRAFAGAT